MTVLHELICPMCGLEQALAIDWRQEPSDPSVGYVGGLYVDDGETVCGGCQADMTTQIEEDVWRAERAFKDEACRVAESQAEERYDDRFDRD